MKVFVFSVCLLIAFGSLGVRAQMITTVAGLGHDGAGVVGYTGPATGATLVGADGVAVDRLGNVYFTDRYFNVIRKISADGRIHTIAGKGYIGYLGDYGPATNAELADPGYITVDSAGNIYFADKHRLRRVNTSGIINTIAGTGTPGFSGDGGPASVAQINLPAGVAVDATGNIYFCDQGNNRIRKISGGVISTVCGTGTEGYTGDGAAATAATISYPSGIAIGPAGDIYFCDGGYSLFTGVLFEDSTDKRIRRINSAGIITTIAGGRTGLSFADGLPATDGRVAIAAGIAVDATGSVYYIDTKAERVRRINTTGTIETIAGTGVTFGWFDTEGGLAKLAKLYYPMGIAINSANELYFTDEIGGKLRKVSPATLSISSGGMDTACTGTNVTFRVLDTGAYHYRWHVNGVVVGADSTAYTTNTLHNKDIIDCVRLTGTGGAAIAISNAIRMTINPDPGEISGQTNVCSGMPYPYTSSVPGGVWSVSNALASITTSGVLTGIGMGYDTVVYTVTSGCGSVSSFYRISIDTNGGCVTKLPTITEGLLNVFPNPTTGVVSLSFHPQAASEDMKVTLWNSVGNEIGRAVKTIAMPSLKFDLSAFPSGMYFVVVQNQYGELVFRSPVIKQ